MGDQSGQSKSNPGRGQSRGAGAGAWPTPSDTQPRASETSASETSASETSASETSALDGAYRIGVTGHRVLGPEEQIARVRAECARIFADALEAHAGHVIAISAIAEGADRLFANVALEQGISLIAVLPFAAYEKDFETTDSIEEFHRLRDTAIEVTRLEFAERSDEAYLAGGKWIADQSDLLVAIWDEKPARGLGGTADIVEYARGLGKAVQIIHVDR